MRRLLLAVALPLYVLDQITKLAVLRFLEEDSIIPVIPGFFNLVYVTNTGAAFGMLKGANTFFIALSFVALGILVWLLRRGSFRDRWSQWAAVLLLSGVAGNLTDRIAHGHVIDFLDFILPIYGRWPAFNVADSCICVAAGLFILSAIFDGKSRPAAKESSQP